MGGHFRLAGLTPLGEFSLNPSTGGATPGGPPNTIHPDFAMSEDDKQPPKPPKPMKKTSAVPLKKETVRVTLKATDDAPKGPPAPTASKPGDSPPAPAPTIPLRTAGPSGAPAPRPAAPAPTVQLRAPGATTAPKTTPLKTQPLATPGAQGTQPSSRPACFCHSLEW
jgi:hypothetical protein